eukprot:g627.t1
MAGERSRGGLRILAVPSSSASSTPKPASNKEQDEALQEVRVLESLVHPHIVAYHHSFVERGSLHIVLAYCDGGDLAQLLKRRIAPLPEKQTLFMLIQISSALKYLHARSILHRDLKTQNIFLTRTGVLKLGDFGIARVLENSADMASTMIGTPYNMSPELCENRAYDEKSDMWALGCVLYELITLRKAFEGKSIGALVLRIVRGEYDKLRQRLRAEAAAVVKKQESDLALRKRIFAAERQLCRAAANKANRDRKRAHLQSVNGARPTINIAALRRRRRRQQQQQQQQQEEEEEEQQEEQQQQEEEEEQEEEKEEEEEEEEEVEVVVVEEEEQQQQQQQQQQQEEEEEEEDEEGVGVGGGGEDALASGTCGMHTCSAAVNVVHKYNGHVPRAVAFEVKF